MENNIINEKDIAKYNNEKNKKNSFHQSFKKILVQKLVYKVINNTNNLIDKYNKDLEFKH